MVTTISRLYRFMKSTCISGPTQHQQLHKTACNAEEGKNMLGALSVHRFAKGLIYRGQGHSCKSPVQPVIENNT
jgi:hypothetical protein